MLLITALEIAYAFGVMFIICELCQRANISFDECNDMIVQFDWYLLPADVQRMLTLILIFEQQPIEVICFGSTACNRETFKYVNVIEIDCLLACFLFNVIS